MKLFFDDEAFDGQLQRSVGKADSGMANVGECLAIAGQITPATATAGHQAWSGFAGRLVDQADAALAAGHRVSARDAYLRAAEYHRQAFFFHRDDLDGAELRAAYPAGVAAFRAALPLLDHPASVLEGDTPGYFFAPAGADGPFPTIVHIGGYDGTAEELYASAAPALDRGYAFAALDGPGPGLGALRPAGADATRLGARRAGHGRPGADPTRGRSGARRAGGAFVRRGAGAPWRGRRTAVWRR